MNEQFSDDDILVQLADRPVSDIDEAVPVEQTRHRQKTTIRSATSEQRSTIGHLDELPIEILWECFAYLDLLSLSQLSLVSLRGRDVVASIPAYRLFVKTVGKDWNQTLSRARVLHNHSIMSLIAILLTKACVSCGRHGPLLHLIELVRCCRDCLKVNRSLWIISLRQARACFGISKKRARTLPFRWSNFGQYSCSRTVDHKQSIRITTVGAAIRLSRSVYGSMESLEMKYPVDVIARSETKRRVWRWYRQASSEEFSIDLMITNDSAQRLSDRYCRLGAIVFPSFRKNSIEYGLGCQACKAIYADHKSYKFRIKDSSTLPRLVPACCYLNVFSGQMIKRARCRPNLGQDDGDILSALPMISSSQAADHWYGPVNVENDINELGTTLVQRFADATTPPLPQVPSSLIPEETLLDTWFHMQWFRVHRPRMPRSSIGDAFARLVLHKQSEWNDGRDASNLIASQRLC